MFFLNAKVSEFIEMEKQKWIREIESKKLEEKKKNESMKKIEEVIEESFHEEFN